MIVVQPYFHASHSQVVVEHQVATSIAEADALREELERRSVFIVGLPTSDDTDGLVPLPQSKEDLRWRASVPLPGLDAWQLESHDANAPLCTDQGCWDATPHLATLRDRLDQRVSNVKALLQLCKGALPCDD